MLYQIFHFCLHNLALYLVTVTIPNNGKTNEKISTLELEFHQISKWLNHFFNYDPAFPSLLF